MSKRNVAEVIARVLEIVPENEHEFRAALTKVAEDSRWKAPDIHFICWERGACAFQNRFGDEPPLDGWQRRAFDIWMGIEAPPEPGGVAVDASSELMDKPTSILEWLRGLLR